MASRSRLRAHAPNPTMHRTSTANTATFNNASIFPSTESRLPLEVLICRRPELFRAIDAWLNVRFWHKADIDRCPCHVCFRGNSGHWATATGFRAHGRARLSHGDAWTATVGAGFSERMTALTPAFGCDVGNSYQSIYDILLKRGPRYGGKPCSGGNLSKLFVA